MTRDERFAVMEDGARSLGADRAAVIEAGAIVLNPVFRAMCEANTCGAYGTCWMCPPDAGDIDVLMERVRSYSHALVFQKVFALEDSFDIEGMLAAKEQHHALCQRMRENFRKTEMKEHLLLGAGRCGVCCRCAKLDGEPCRFPEKAYSSLEAHGVDVTKLAKAAGMRYTNGADTVTYFGVVLFNLQ